MGEKPSGRDTGKNIAFFIGFSWALALLLPLLYYVWSEMIWVWLGWTEFIMATGCFVWCVRRYRSVDIADMYALGVIVTPIIILVLLLTGNELFPVTASYALFMFTGLAVVALATPGEIFMENTVEAREKEGRETVAGSAKLFVSVDGIRARPRIWVDKETGFYRLAINYGDTALRLEMYQDDMRRLYEEIKRALGEVK